MQNNHTHRIAQFFTLLLVGTKLDAEAIGQIVENEDVLLHYIGNGASDSLTVGDIRKFLEEYQDD